MANLPADDKIILLLTVFKHSNLPKPDYNAIAVELGINNAQNAQRRFRSAIQKFGWDLVNDQIVSPDGCTGGGEGTAATPVKKGRGKKSPAKKVANDEILVKKRKLSDSVVDSASEEDVKQEDEAKVNGGSEGAEAKANGEAAAED